MQDIDDSEYYHDGSDDDNKNEWTGGDDACHLPVPTQVRGHEAGHETAYARLIRLMQDGLPSGFNFDAERGLIVVEKDARPVCGPLRVVALLRKPQHSAYHYLIEFANREHEVRELVFSAEELEKTPIHLPAGLAKDGMWIPGSKAHVVDLVRQWHCNTFGTLLLQPGWGRAGSLPIYAQVSGTIFWPLREPKPLARLSKPLRDEQVAGTFAGWRQEVATLALGNPARLGRGRCPDPRDRSEQPHGPQDLARRRRPHSRLSPVASEYLHASRDRRAVKPRGGLTPPPRA